MSILKVAHLFPRFSHCEHGCTFALVQAGGGLYADAAPTDHGCTRIGVAPKDVLCEVEVVRRGHMRLTVKQGAARKFAELLAIPFQKANDVGNSPMFDDRPAFSAKRGLFRNQNNLYQRYLKATRYLPAPILVEWHWS
jgi:hypothetical protein